jgi:hypothetical protein
MSADDTPAPTAPDRWTIDADGWLCDGGLAVVQLSNGPEGQGIVLDALNRAEAAPGITALLDTPRRTAEKVRRWLRDNRWSDRLMLVGGGCAWSAEDVLAAVAALAEWDTDR